MQNAAVYIREYSIQSNDTFASAAKETHTALRAFLGLAT